MHRSGGIDTDRLEVVLIEELGIPSGLGPAGEAVDEVLGAREARGGDLSEDQVEFLDQALSAEGLTVAPQMASNR